MDKEKIVKITHLLNHAFNLLECDKEGSKFVELKEMIWNARNLSSWMYNYGKDEIRDRDDFLLILEDLM